MCFPPPPPPPVFSSNNNKLLLLMPLLLPILLTLLLPLLLPLLGSRIQGGYPKPVCDEYGFQARIEIWIYLGRNFLANTTTIIFRLKFYGKYKYIPIPFFRRIQINLGLPKMGKFEYKYNYFDWYLQIWIWILSQPK